MTGGEDRAPQAVVEVERKYKVHGLFRMPPLTDLPGVAELRAEPRVAMLATYLDTADLRLARSGASLRRREGGADAGWHLKLPTGDSGVRIEHRVALGDAPDEPVPGALADLATAWVRTAELLVVAQLRTERDAVDLLDAAGDLIATVTDDTVSVLDVDRVAARFREVEVESGPAASDDLLAELDRRLHDAGAIQGEFVSKVARALGPAAAGAPDVAAPRAPHPADPAGEAIAAYVTTQVRALLTQDPRVRQDLPDAVHQMRVAARRLRSGLKVFGPLLEPQWAEPLRAELAWLAGSLGAARDREVLEQRLLRDLRQLPDHTDAAEAAEVVVDALESGIESARAEALSALRSERYRLLLDQLVAAVHRPGLLPAAEEPAATVLPPLVAHAWRRLAKQVRRLTLDSADEPWHEARISAKRVRYAAEAVAIALDADARKMAKRMAVITELLGEHQDAAVAAERIVELAHRPGVSGAAGFALGELHAMQRRAVVAARQEFLAAWPEVAQRKTVGWLQ